MSCARPLIRFYNPNDHNITGSVMSMKMAKERFKNPNLTYDDIAYRKDCMLIPCGKCLACRLRMRQDWQTRMELEATEWDKSEIWFITFTYNEKNVPGMIRNTGEIKRGIGHSWKPGTEAPQTVSILLMEDIVNFNKKLRRRQETAKNDYWGKDLRYFYAGEYGEQTGRPHYHGIYYGLSIPDLKKEHGRNPYWRSESLEKLWKYGNVIIAPAEPQTYGYVAGYVTKKMYTQDNKKYQELGLQPPQAGQSRNPGLGMAWFEKHKEELWTSEKIYLSGGKIAPIPRYFEKMLEQENPQRLWDIKAERQSRAIMALKDAQRQTDLNIEEQKAVKDYTLRQKFKHRTGTL